MKLASAVRDVPLLRDELLEPLEAVLILRSVATDEVDPFVQPPAPLRDRALLLLETGQIPNGIGHTRVIDSSPPQLTSA